MLKIARGTYYAGVILLFLLVAAAGFTQTRAFKSSLREFLLRQAERSLDARVWAGPIEGNLLTGFTVHGIQLQVDSTDVLAAERLEVRYDPISVPFQRIALSRLTLVNPVIHVWRGTDGRWNVNRIVKPTPSDSLPSPWTFDLKDIELVGARVSVVDSLDLLERTRENRTLPSGVVDYANLTLDSLHLKVAAQIARGNVFVQLRDLAFVSRDPGFVLQHFQVDLSLTKDLVAISDLRIETPGTRLRLSTALRKTNIARLRSLRELETRPIELSLIADKLDTRELKQFLSPDVDFLDGTYAVRLRAGGMFGSLDVTEATVEMGESTVRLRGKLEHLDRPADLTLDVTGLRNRVHPADLQAYLPGLDIPDLGFLGDVSFDLAFTGTPTDFHAWCAGETAAGDFDVDGTLKIDAGTLTYKGVARTREADLALLTGRGRLSSRLNSRITFDGTGTDPRTMIALLRAEVDSSSVAGMPVRQSVFVVDAADATLRAHGQVRVGPTSLDFSGAFAFGESDSIAYTADGHVSSLSLSDILGRPSLTSDLGFAFKAAGERRKEGTIDSVSLSVLPSVIGGEPLAETDITLLLRRDRDRGDKLRLRSDFCDLDVDGEFTVASLIAGVERSVQMTSYVVRRYGSDLDSLRGTPAAALSEMKPAVAGDSLSLNARFHLDVQDMYQFGVVLFEKMEGDLILDGSIEGRGNDVHVAATVDASEFAWAFPRDTLVLLRSKVSLDLAGDHREQADRLPAGTFELNGRALALRSVLFADPRVAMAMTPDSAQFQASTFIDSVVRVDLAGTGRLDRRILNMHVRRLSLGMGAYRLENGGPFGLRYGADGFAVDRARFVHESEEASLEGFFNPSGESNLQVGVRGFLLPNLNSILHGIADVKALQRYSGTVHASGMFTGTFEAPQFTFELTADDVRVRKTVFAGDRTQERDAVLGNVAGRLAYANRMLELFLRLKSSPKDTAAPPDLLLSGVVPFDLTLASGSRRALEGEIDVQLTAQGFSMEFLDPFIPEVSGLTGRMTCDMRMRGPVEGPRYEGSMQIRNARFMFDPVDLRYILNADLVAAGDRIELQNTTIRNVPEDNQPDALMTVDGDFRMLGLKFRNFDLLAKGSLLVMNSQVRRPGQEFYGRLFIAPGPAGLHWEGNLKESSLKGEVFVRRASLTFPPEREAENQKASRIAVMFRDDTSRTPFVREESVRRPSLNPFAETGAVVRTASTEERSFLDGIRYDMSLETQGSTQIRLVFNAQTNEELYADLQGRLYFFRTPEVARLTGSVEVSNRSYYNFIKKFTVAEGKLLYTGDPLNPEIDLSAQYVGEHRIRDSVSSQLGQVEKVVVTLKITGTRNEPKPKMSLEVDDKKRVTGEEESDALSFILSGQFRDELTDQQRTGLIGTNLGFGIASGMLTGPLSEMLRRETGVIQSVDVLYYGGGSFDRSADVRLTGQVGEAVIRLGGRVLTDLNNTNASVELPMSSITGNIRLRNLILTLERRVEGIENIDERRRSSNGARLYYRFSF